MIKCKICGESRRYQIFSHLIKTHKISTQEYKKKYNAEVVSQEHKDDVSVREKKKWGSKKFKSKMSAIRKKQFTKEVRDKISKTKKERYKNGQKNWNVGKSKNTDPRCASIGEKNKKRLSGRTKKDYPYLQRHSDLMKKRWREGAVSSKMVMNNSEWMSKEEYKEWKNKISKIISLKYKNGEIRFSNKMFKFGKYKKWNYDSGFELKVMELLDSRSAIVKSWKKDFDIISYVDSRGEKRRYIPDFFITFHNGTTAVIETKGYDKKKENIRLKEKAAKEKYENYKICYSLKEVESILNEFSKNKKDK